MLATKPSPTVVDNPIPQPLDKLFQPMNIRGDSKICGFTVKTPGSFSEMRELLTSEIVKQFKLSVGRKCDLRRELVNLLADKLNDAIEGAVVSSAFLHRNKLLFDKIEKVVSSIKEQRPNRIKIAREECEGALGRALSFHIRDQESGLAKIRTPVSMLLGLAKRLEPAQPSSNEDGKSYPIRFARDRSAGRSYRPKPKAV